ncbi:hypothetical protein [Streptacidiphilus sp. EB129]|uniref:hypothetical protein n=1 Tax=Streptacidiphilus sp. EB129 TaxID=3156262 RepID=UPI0035148B24
MSSDEYEVELGELTVISQDFQSISSQMGQLNKQLSQIAGTIAKAAAFDLESSTLLGLPGVLIAGQVLEDVKQISAESARLHSDQQKLVKGLADDAEKLKAVQAEYAATEEKIKASLPKPPPEKPVQGPTGGGTGGGGGGTGGSGGGGTSGGGSTGGSGGAPNGTTSSAHAIPVSQVTFGGKGSYPGGQAACEQSINEALDRMGITDPTARANWMRGMLTIASRESAYNSPMYQVNTTDVNAHGALMPDGAPADCSRGGWQCIPSTFAAYHQPGTSTDIYDPVSNCCASMNYIMSRYHVSADGSNLASNVQQADPGRRPRGY